jgi:hypothetical protein
MGVEDWTDSVSLAKGLRENNTPFARTAISVVFQGTSGGHSHPFRSHFP